MLFPSLPAASPILVTLVTAVLTVHGKHYLLHVHISCLLENRTIDRSCDYIWNDRQGVVTSYRPKSTLHQLATMGTPNCYKVHQHLSQSYKDLQPEPGLVAQYQVGSSLNISACELRMWCRLQNHWRCKQVKRNWIVCMSLPRITQVQLYK